MEATLQEILEARERRAQRQKQLLDRYGKPLICFTMNIPGPVKYDEAIAGGFQIGCARLEAQLEGMSLVFQERLPRHTGCEAFFVVDAPAEAIKALTCQLEDADELGRLFDMDVFCADGTRLERTQGRKCLLCDQSAKVCGRTRAHGLDALWAKTQQILRRALDGQFCQKIAAMAQKALLWEACTAPKPGLVDRLGSGSHLDMDIFTFMGSAAVLGGYFAQCARAGLEEQDTQGLFARLRMLGKEAQQTMLAETRQVNTHKGAIFTMGLLCGAAGRQRFGDTSPEAILAVVAQMCRGLTDELAGLTEETAKTAGQKLYVRHGITGIRGQAEQGYPAILHTGLPMLTEGLAKGLSPERAGCGALLAMLTATQDTNLLTRGGVERTRQLTRQIALLLAKNPYPDADQLQALDSVFQEERLSPGGTADLLAACWFLHFIQENGVA